MHIQNSKNILQNLQNNLSADEKNILSEIENVQDVTLPSNFYFSEDILQIEKAKRLQQSPANYLGAKAMVKEHTQYQTLMAENHARVLINQNDDVRLLSNICKHRQALMLKNQGFTEKIICPLHRWTYQMDGQLQVAPHFNPQPCAKLQNYPIQEWQGLLFENADNLIAEISQSKYAKYFNFSDYHLGSVHVHECDYNWKTFIEVYLEDYHVAPFHPGLGKFVDCQKLDWEFGENYSVQTVGIHQGLQNPGSAVYKAWQQSILNFRQDQIPEYGAIWLTYYPYLMLEWYPHVLVASHLHPISPTKTRNIVEFYYPEEVALFEPELIKHEQKAYMETCIEDDEIAERMDQGRFALYQQGLSEYGPYQMPMEAGMQHFHNWYRRFLLK